MNYRGHHPTKWVHMYKGRIVKPGLDFLPILSMYCGYHGHFPFKIRPRSVSWASARRTWHEDGLGPGWSAWLAVKE